MAAASSASTRSPARPGPRRGPPPAPGPSASSRSTMASTRAATRAWNCTRPSVAAMTSRSRNSRTASTSWAALGASCSAGRGSAARRPGSPSGRGSGRAATDQGRAGRTRSRTPADRWPPARPSGWPPTGGPRPGARRSSPQRRVPSASHQRRWSGSTGGAGRRARRRRSARRRSPRPATGRSEPNRQARTHSQPRSSIGSPRWASSQSSTAARPSSSTMRLPSRKSPCTTPGSTGGGRWSSSQRSPSSKAGWGWPSASSRPRSWSHRIVGAQVARPRSAPGDGCRPGPRRTDRPGRARAAANWSSRRMRRAMVSPSTRPMTRNGAPEHRRRRRRPPPPAPPAPRRRPRPRSRPASPAMVKVALSGPARTRCRISGRDGPVEGVEQVERPGLARRAAGQAAQAADLGALLVEGVGQEVAQRRGDLVGPHGAGP